MVPAEATSTGASTTDSVGADILVVDDNAANLLAIEAALGQLSARVVRAQSGGEALRLMLERDFALVLLDVNMPSMGGFETARIIRARKRSRHTPIIFITAYGRDDRDVLAAYELGAVDFLFKPIVPAMLHAKASVFVELQNRTAEVAHQAEQIREHQRREHERALEQERHRWQELALRREMEQLAETDRRKDQFLAVLAHELRTPLSPIVTGLELIREKLARAPVVDSALLQVRATMERQARHLTRLVDDLLDISRISSGKIELRSEALDLRGVVTQAVAACRQLLDERRHQLSIDLAQDSLIMRGDEVRLFQIVANLLNNAARYTPEGGTIRISCERDDAQPTQVVLRVRDDGAGIAAELLPHIFEVFVQERPAKGDGLGLGLSVVSRLVGLHGGTVDAYSDGPGLGSEFVVRFPLEAKMALVEAAADGGSRKLRAVKAFRPLRIVLIEDNQDIRDMFSDLLSIWHHSVVMAEDGESGAKLVIETQPDIALVDVGLPKLDGYGVAIRIRQALGSRVRLVAMTGYGQDSDKEKALAAGFDVHLVKPVDVEALRHVLSFEESDASPADAQQIETEAQDGSEAREREREREWQWPRAEK